MKKIKIILAIIVCKLTRAILRMTGRGGTNLPGKVAVRICPDLLKYLASDVRCVVVTGTNGKTTSARIIERAYKIARMGCLANRSGANLLTGITAEFAANATLLGRPKLKHAVIECDEAASGKVFEYINPAVVLVTNVFRDQLDRFGEITHTLMGIQNGCVSSKNAVIVINADDSLCVSIADKVDNKILYYGADAGTIGGGAGELSDATHCIKCKAEYEYEYVTYAHLGGFRCPECGYSRPEPNIAVTEVTAREKDATKIIVNINGDERPATVNLPGEYNVYNALGAITALTALGFSTTTSLDAVESFECGFGRMEKLSINKREMRMILVKNPAGCNQALEYISGLGTDALFVACLNDNTADGIDVSWIWDANFEKLADMGDRLSGALVSGKRSYDMAIRLKYAGLDASKITVIEDYGELIDTAAAQDEPVFIIPTYTAMMELRDMLSGKYGLRDFWE